MMVDAARLRQLLDRLRGGVFAQLEEAGHLTADLADRLAAMARFRDLLVHGYADVDDDRVIEILHGDPVSDLARFRHELVRVLDR